MSIYGAMFSGVSGLAAQAQALGMISDNISNVNTIGYKATVARFSTLVTEAASSTTYSPGGVRATPYGLVDRQGLLQASSSATDLAITGNGFFVVNEASAPATGDQYFYTRAGSFNVDASGNLVTPSEYFLQGWRLDASGNLPASTTLLTDLETVNVAALTGAASPTTSIGLAMNLPAQSAVADSFNNTVSLYDKQGATQSIQLTWDKTAVNTWTLTANLPGGASIASDDTAGASLSAANVPLATVVFNADGTLQSITGTPPYGTVNATNQLDVYLDYDSNAATTSVDDRQLVSLGLGSLGLGNGLTQYAGSFTISSIDQNGAAFGSFTGVSVDENGIVTAIFDNGRQRNIFQLPIAIFSNPNGLQAQNGNVYLDSQASGPVLLQEARVGGAGRISPGALEASTVDIAEEFTNMIITQRAYSANARVITTADEMLEELIRIRR
jgi:flagellar hook protein FlgE